MTQLEITEVLGAATLNENLALLLVVLTLVGLAVGLVWGVAVIQETFFQAKEAADESAFYVQEHIPPQYGPVYRTDGTRLWDKWSAPYVPQEQPKPEPEYLPAGSLNRIDRVLITHLAKTDKEAADTFTYYMAYCQDGKAAMAATCVREYLRGL